jgi:hypothetical protein
MDCRHGWTRTALLFGVALLAVLVVSSGGAVGESVGSETNDVSESPMIVFEPILFQSGSTTNSSNQSPESPPPHRNPAEIESSSSSAQLEAFLRGSIDQDLARSLENVDEEQYQLAREQLGEDFDENLRRYVESSDEFDTEEQAELLTSLESNHEAYIDAVESYETTQAAYESARESGETARSRELSRELITDAERVSTTGDSVANNYRELGNVSGQDYSDRTNQIQQRTKTTNSTATTVRSEFTETSLSVRANRSTVRFTDAIQLSGRIQTASGSSVDRQQAVLSVGAQRYTVAVGSDGTFEVVVEPDGVWRETDEIEVNYQPPPESALLGSDTTLPLSVSTTETRVEITSVSEEVSYDRPLVINGTLLTADGEPVPDTPVSVRTDETRLVTTETTSEGRFSAESTLPATIPAGETEFYIGLRSSLRALVGSETEITTQITTTDPVMSVNATSIEASNSDPRLGVEGQLISPNGRSIEGESVTVFVEGEAVSELTTNSEGLFRGEFDVPDGTASSTETTVEATYEPPQSNLNAVSESTTVVLSETLLESIGLSADDAVPLGIGVFVGLVGVLGGAGWWLRQTPAQQTLSTETDQPVSPGVDGVDSTDLIASATAQLNAGANETAATIAYMAARRELSETETVDIAETATHWEWYQACVAAEVNQLSDLETLVEAFEQVVFAPDTAETSAAASQAVSAAKRFCEFE